MNDFSKNLKVPVFGIDYRLAPKVKYPELNNDCITGYLWILQFLTEHMKVNPSKVVVAGDSAGGSLALMLTTWCIENGVRVPDYLHLHYPSIDKSKTKVQPSKMYELQDPVLNYATCSSFSSAYIPATASPDTDYYLSPTATPVALLRQYPLVDIFACENDPLYDDAFRLAYKLEKADVEYRIFAFRHLNHGILCMANSVKEGREYIKQSEKRLSLALALE